MTQRSVELRRNQGDVAPLRQHVGRLLQVPQIGTNRHCTRTAKTRAGEHHQALRRSASGASAQSPAPPSRLCVASCGRPDRGAREYHALWCSGRTGRGDHNCRVHLDYRLIRLEHRDRASPLDRSAGSVAIGCPPLKESASAAATSEGSTVRSGASPGRAALTARH